MGLATRFQCHRTRPGHTRLEKQMQMEGSGLLRKCKGSILMRWQASVKASSFLHSSKALRILICKWKTCLRRQMVDSEHQSSMMIHLVTRMSMSRSANSCSRNENSSLWRTIGVRLLRRRQWVQLRQKVTLSALWTAGSSISDWIKQLRVVQVHHWAATGSHSTIAKTRCKVASSKDLLRAHKTRLLSQIVSTMQSNLREWACISFYTKDQTTWAWVKGSRCPMDNQLINRTVIFTTQSPTW